MLGNVTGGYSDYFKVTYCTIQPSPATYPFQYFWDTCLHVFILTALREFDLAKKNITSLFAAQQPDGFVGHLIYWNRIRPAKWHDLFQSRFSDWFHPHMSALIQPPLAAQAVERIDLYEDGKDKQFLEHMVPRLIKYYDWLAANRDFDGGGLLSIITNFESGIDWKPTYDPIVGFPNKPANERLRRRVIYNDFRNFLRNYDLRKISRDRYFNVKDVCFNTIYAQNLKALAGLCRKVGKTHEAERYTKLAQRLYTAIVEQMYDEHDAAFYDLNGNNNSKIKILTPTIFFPIVLRDLPNAISERVLSTHFFNDQEFDLPYPIPSIAKNEPSFNPNQSEYLWRGPTWIVYNWFVYQCLFCKGFKDEAKKLSGTIRKLVAKSGFREYYNPLTGEGYGATDFTWSGLVVDMLDLEESEK
jgi:glycogen debranching enzyme